MNGNPELRTTWRALECLSQTQAERRQDKTRRPRQATGCGSERGEPSLEEMFAVCSSRVRLAAWGAAAHCEVVDSEALESGSPGRAAAEAAGGEISVMGRIKISVSGNDISLRCG